MSPSPCLFIAILNWARKSWLAPFSYKGKPLGSHMVGWKYLVHPYTPTMIGWIMGGGVHRKASARNVTHPSTQGSHGIRVKALGLSHPIGNKNHLKAIAHLKQYCYLALYSCHYNVIFPFQIFTIVVRLQFPLKYFIFCLDIGLSVISHFFSEISGRK